jgi:TPR repeat protein
MSGSRAVPHVLLFAILAINLISFTHFIHAQQCHTAHDKNALKVLEERAAAGEADAQCGLGKQYEYALGVPLDYEQSVSWLLKSAAQNGIIAQVELGVVYDKMQDYVQAFAWYSKAAETGNARAEYNLGLAYGNGESVPKDLAQASAWFQKAADQGDALAQSNLAVNYERGLGVAQNYRQAADLYRKAAEQGLAEAQYGLGFLYLNGNGVPKDDTQATTWMLKAAEQGETKAEFNLGVCYLNGAGVNRDLNEAYFWIFLSHTRTTDRGLKEHAENTLEALTKVMKKSDIKGAQKRAQAWLNKHPIGAVQ